MKVIHIESGLGNQMLSYCEYLAIKKANPADDVYIENIIYDIPECNEVICQWNGYELERIFGIKAPNIKDCFSEEQWKQIMADIRASEFWDKNWNYPVHITAALNRAGLHLKNIRGDFEAKGSIRNVNMKKPHKQALKDKLRESYPGNLLRRIYYRCNEKQIVARTQRNAFLKTEDNIFTGQFLNFKYRENGIERIVDEIKKVFQFPALTNPKDIELSAYLSKVNGVAIHARRGDMLGCNGYCYKYGYFRRAVKHIKKRVENPAFVFFTDPGSIEWCKKNERIFALDFTKDKVLFVDWNKDENSYRDMQLMSCCKHAIITNSTFGWWGAYFIDNPQKITISPVEVIGVNTTYHL